MCRDCKSRLTRKHFAHVKYQFDETWNLSIDFDNRFSSKLWFYILANFLFHWPLLRRESCLCGAASIDVYVFNNGRSVLFRGRSRQDQLMTRTVLESSTHDLARSVIITMRQLSYIRADSSHRRGWAVEVSASGESFKKWYRFRTCSCHSIWICDSHHFKNWTINDLSR